MMMKGYIEAQRTPSLGASDASGFGLALLDGQLGNVATRMIRDDICG